MNKELIHQLLELTRKVAPEIEAAVSGVKDGQVRGVIAGAIMQRILEGLVANNSQGLGAATKFPVKSYDIEKEVKTSGTQGRILDLRGDSFFAEPRSLDQVLDELRNRGYHHNKADVRMSLLRLARKKLLRRIPLGTGKQKPFSYVNP